MEQVKLNDAPETTAVAYPGKGQTLTLPILIARMMQTQKDIEAYKRGEMTKEEFDALGISFG